MVILWLEFVLHDILTKFILFVRLCLLLVLPEHQLVVLDSLLLGEEGLSGLLTSLIFLLSLGLLFEKLALPDFLS